MRYLLLPVICAVAMGLVARAQAAREYYLVGLRHVYMFDVWPDTHRADREAIEEAYAGALASAQQLYDADMASIRQEEVQDGGNLHVVDRDAVQQNLEQDIAEAADARDDGLGQLYVQCDYVRGTHPEFEVDQDGPYEVVGCDVTPDGDFQDICFYKPYPDYPGPCPLGWSWESPYPVMAFSFQVNAYHQMWLASGAPVFGPMYYSGTPVIILGPVRRSVIINRLNWAGGRPPAISDDERRQLSQNRELQRKAGLRPPSAHPGVKHILSVAPAGTSSRYVRTPAVPSNSVPTSSRYSHRSAPPARSGPPEKGPSKPPAQNRNRKDPKKGG